jgi:hypothetical protein
VESQILLSVLKLLCSLRQVMLQDICNHKGTKTAPCFTSATCALFLSHQ